MGHDSGSGLEMTKPESSPMLNRSAPSDGLLCSIVQAVLHLRINPRSAGSPLIRHSLTPARVSSLSIARSLLCTTYRHWSLGAGQPRRQLDERIYRPPGDRERVSPEPQRDVRRSEARAIDTD